MFKVENIAFALASYTFRKKKGWGIPKAPDSFKVGKVIIGLIILLAIILPLFGLSALLIFAGQYLFRERSLA